MNPRSAKSLLWLSVLLLATGAAVASPAAAVLAAVAASACAIAPIVSGSRRVRLAGVVALAAAISLAVASWPAAKAHLDGYRGRAVGRKG